MAEYSLAVLASGEGSNLQALIDEVHGTWAQICLVLSDRDDAGAFKRARSASIPALSLVPHQGEGRESFHRRMGEVLLKANPDLIVLAGYMRLLPGDFIQTMCPIINVHPSLLPVFPGMEAPAQALSYGVKVSGCTVHLVDEGMDTGPIIKQLALEVFPGDTPATLHQRIKELEHRALVDVVKGYAQGRVKSREGKFWLEEEEGC